MASLTIAEETPEGTAEAPKPTATEPEASEAGPTFEPEPAATEPEAPESTQKWRMAKKMPKVR